MAVDISLAKGSRVGCSVMMTESHSVRAVNLTYDFNVPLDYINSLSGTTKIMRDLERDQDGMSVIDGIVMQMKQHIKDTHVIISIKNSIEKQHEKLIEISKAVLSENDKIPKLNIKPAYKITFDGELTLTEYVNRYAADLLLKHVLPELHEEVSGAVEYLERITEDINPNYVMDLISSVTNTGESLSERINAVIESIPNDHPMWSEMLEVDKECKCDK